MGLAVLAGLGFVTGVGVMLAVFTGVVSPERPLLDDVALRLFALSVLLSVGP